MGKRGFEPALGPYEHDYRSPEYKTDSMLRKNYGITLAQYDQMLLTQRNGCLICGKSPEENGRRLAVDHDHASGMVRGLLCSNCNSALGKFQDDPVLLRAAAEYLESYAVSE